MRNTRQRRTLSCERFKAEVNRWVGKIKTQPVHIRIQRMTRKWASCSPHGRISFNSELLTQPRHFQEFVIVHELIHIKVPNHGKLFKSLVKAYLPELKNYHDLFLPSGCRRC